MQEEKPDTLTRYQLGGKVDLCGKWMSCVHYKVLTLSWQLFCCYNFSPSQVKRVNVKCITVLLISVVFMFLIIFVRSSVNK